MELNEINKIQDAFAEISRIGQNLINEIPKDLPEEQREEYEKIINGSKVGQQMKEALGVLNKRREELNKMTRDFQNFSTK